MPSAKTHNNRKWRALFAHLSLLRSPIKSNSHVTCANKSPVTSSCPIALLTDITFASHSPASTTDFDSADLCFHLDSTKIPCLEADRVVPVKSSALSNDVDQLLYMCLHRPYDFDKQARSLDALCTLCSATPGAAERCVDSGGIETMLGMLNSSPQPRHTPLIPSPFVENSEKALRLLHLIITSSEAGCVAALRQTNLVITTLGKRLLRVSEACTASAIAILWALCCRSEAALFRKAVSETAIPSKLVVVLQVASKDSTKSRAGRLLRLLAEQQQEEKSSYTATL